MLYHLMFCLSLPPSGLNNCSAVSTFPGSSTRSLDRNSKSPAVLTLLQYIPISFCPTKLRRRVRS